MNWEFATATRILFGPGTLREAAPSARALGRRVLLVTGRSPRLAAPLVADLHALSIGCTVFPVAAEPDIDTITRGMESARREQCDVVISCGGGAAIDAGKAIAALLTNPGGVLDYLEVVGQGQPILVPPAPFIAIPTTSGAGSEVTRNAVILSREHQFKASLRSPLLLARLAIVDPELTLTLPPALTASTGLDALTQLIEPYTSARANPLTDALCLAGIERSARSLRRAFHEPANLEARTDLAYAALCGGLALANAGLGAVHGFAAPIGGQFPAPHGAVCAALLPHVVRANQRHAPTQIRFKQIAHILSGGRSEDLPAILTALTADLQIPPLGAYGITETHLTDLCAKAAQASSMKANPIALTPAELEAILRASLD